MTTHEGNTAYLLTGGNMGNRVRNLAEAHDLIAAGCGSIITASRIFETAAWGMADQPAFLNQALEINTLLSPLELLHCTLSIEKKMGRLRAGKNGPRLIDIDIILFGREVIKEPELKIPHPEMANRRFVLVPLASIAPHIVHPVLDKTIEQLLLNCPDTLEVIDYRPVS
jgi:2-amino-4-hydroxy-6-hydroxymethyldihydropteridine diphosphokinase